MQTGLLSSNFVTVHGALSLSRTFKQFMERFICSDISNSAYRVLFFLTFLTVHAALLCSEISYQCVERFICSDISNSACCALFIQRFLTVLQRFICSDILTLSGTVGGGQGGDFYFLPIQRWWGVQYLRPSKNRDTILHCGPLWRRGKTMSHSCQGRI